jgi:hypothetical protein
MMNFLTLINKTKALMSQLTPWKIALILLLLGHNYIAQAVVVQNGRGLIGVMNQNYSTSLTGRTTNPTGTGDGTYNRPWNYVYLAFYPDSMLCNQSLLMEIDGVTGIKFNTAGTLMLVPEVTYVDNRTWIGGSDTVTGVMNGSGSNTNFGLGTSTTCVWQPNQPTPPSNKDASLSVTHNVTATGRVLIYGTGTQTSSTGTLANPFKMMIRNPRAPAPYPQGILMNAGSYSVIVNDLSCTLTTPTLIDFGPQPANSVAGEELATRTSNLSVNCSQSKNPIGATLSLIAGINPTYYSGNEYEVNLLKNGSGTAGAYVKMSIDVNGTTTPVAFNRQFINVGAITAAESTASFNHPVTYTLYSRGAGITGKVSGSAELSIVMR